MVPKIWYMNWWLCSKLYNKVKNFTASFSVVFFVTKKIGIFSHCLAYSETQFGIFCFCELGNTVCWASLWLAIPRCTKEYAWPTNWWRIFMYFLDYWLKMFFLGILSIQCKIWCDRPSETRQSSCQYSRPATHPRFISVF